MIVHLKYPGPPSRLSSLARRDFLAKIALIGSLVLIPPPVAEQIRASAGAGLSGRQLAMAGMTALLGFAVFVCCARPASLVLLRQGRPFISSRIEAERHLDTALALWFCGMVCLFFGANPWTFQSWSHFLVGGAAGGLGLEILPHGSRSFALAMRHALPSADDLLTYDERAPILYLRSFVDDDFVPYDESVRDYDSGKFWRLDFYTDQRPRRLEEIVCAGLASVAPVVALERPGDVLPPLGAARKRVGEAGWQTEVERLIDRCLGIVVVVALSSGLRWELERLCSLGALRKTVLVLPGRPGDHETWAAFAGAMLTPGAAPVQRMEIPYDGLALAFRAADEVVTFSGPQTPDSYRWIATECFIERGRQVARTGQDGRSDLAAGAARVTMSATK